VIPAKNDHWLIACAVPAHIGPLLESGCRMWLAPAPFDHSKIVTIDNEWCLVGSPNWDIRSLRLNFELAMEICDTAQATELASLFDRKCTVPLGAGDISNRPFLKKLRDQAVRLLMPYL
jgi:cardiolipin synthase